MLLKIITRPSQTPLIGLDVDISGLSAEEAINTVSSTREEFFQSGGVKPVISVEEVIVLAKKYFIYKVSPETKQVGHFAGDCKLPHNCVAVIVQHYSVDMPMENIYITADQEAYVISETGVTVSVINGLKDVERYKGPGFKVDKKGPIEYTKMMLASKTGSLSIDTISGSILITGENLSVTAPTVNFHQDQK